MPQRMQQLFVSICCRCGHTWQSRRGKPLRCARCKSPYWDRAAGGTRLRWIVPPPDPQKAVGGRQVSSDQACDILRTWQANRSWVAIALEDNLALVRCGGFLRAADPFLVEVTVGEGEAGRFFLTLNRGASFEYRVWGDGAVDEPYETLEIRFDQSLVYIGAFRQRPKKLWLML